MRNRPQIDARSELIRAVIPIGLEVVDELLRQEVVSLVGGRYGRNDGAVDLLDVANYHNCFTGAQQENPVSCPTGCAIFDLDPDDAINLLDLPAIQAAMQGP